jgi:hypothetical protein
MLRSMNLFPNSGCSREDSLSRQAELRLWDETSSLAALHVRTEGPDQPINVTAPGELLLWLTAGGDLISTVFLMNRVTAPFKDPRVSYDILFGISDIGTSTETIQVSSGQERSDKIGRFKEARGGPSPDSLPFFSFFLYLVPVL